MRNVYDFDKTIYKGDSTLDFYIFCLRKQPSIVRWWPKQCYGAYLYKVKKITKTRMKEIFYSFLQDINSIELLVDQFWDKNLEKVMTWYVKQQKADDLIISASPEFLLKPVCEKLQIHYLIASKVNSNDGHYVGENCYGQEKVNRFKKEYPNEKIDCFYSDSYSDLPLAQLARVSYLVKDGQIYHWEQ